MTAENAQKTSKKIPVWAWVVIGVAGLAILGALINPKNGSSAEVGSAPSALAVAPKAEPAVTAEAAVEEEVDITEENEAPQPAAQAPAQKVATSGGLSESNAREACMSAGDKLLTYGGKIRWILGAYPAQIVDDQWFFKVEAQPKNEYGTKIKHAMFECYVGGSDTAPVVSDAYIY